MSNQQPTKKKSSTAAVILIVWGVVAIFVVNPATIGGLIPLAIGLFLFWKRNYSDAKQNSQKVIEFGEKITLMESYGFNDFASAKEKFDDLNARYESLSVDYGELTEEYEKRKGEYVAACKQAETAKKKLVTLRELNDAFNYSANSFIHLPPEFTPSLGFTQKEIDELVPSIVLPIHSLDVSDLRKTSKENDKAIDELTASYRTRYTTKSNQTIYDLMVIALRAELQNILIDLKYQKLDRGIDNVKAVTQKYLSIVTAGNQQMLNTMATFIGGLEYLFINAVKIEYNYYVRKEQAHQEQLAIREKMRQEAEERKALELERKRIEKEEAKFDAQIDEINARIAGAAESEIAALRARLLELEGQRAEVVQKKDKIAELQNGKAGNVYIISNLGSFGDNVFKIGMTRRADPQERVDELGSASVPFEFDVHSFIFSDDAVALESALHERLHDRRVNKVNLRKEFFNITLDELEALTHEISPTAEFRRTMAAEQYRQSLSMSE